MRATLQIPSPTIQRSLRKYTVNGHTFQMVVVEKGSFLMQGDHEITFQQDFELGQYPVTQALWEAVMGKNPSRFQGADRPVKQVSWDDIMGTKKGVRQENAKAGFLDRLNALPKIAALNAKDGRGFTLPTEAQWEYAVRGGRYGAAFLYEYAGSKYLPEVCWYRDNCQQENQPVGRKLPNVLGLYDMSGNVWEWCEDDWHDDYNGVPTDGRARVDSRRGAGRVGRGGGWNNSPQDCRVTDRSFWTPVLHHYSLGFRVARYRTTS